MNFLASLFFTLAFVVVIICSLNFSVGCFDWPLNLVHQKTVSLAIGNKLFFVDWQFVSVHSAVCDDRIYIKSRLFYNHSVKNYALDHQNQSSLKIKLERQTNICTYILPWWKKLQIRILIIVKLRFCEKDRIFCEIATLDLTSNLRWRFLLAFLEYLKFKNFLYFICGLPARI